MNIFAIAKLNTGFRLGIFVVECQLRELGLGFRVKGLGNFIAYLGLLYGG